MKRIDRNYVPEVGDVIYESVHHKNGWRIARIEGSSCWLANPTGSVMQTAYHIDCLSAWTHLWVKKHKRVLDWKAIDECLDI